MERIVSARVRAQRWYVRYPRAVPMTIFIAVLTIAALSDYGIERVIAERTRSQVRAAAAEVGAALERRAIAHVTYLRAGAMLMSASARITPGSFGELASGMTDDEGYHATSGIAWSQRVAVKDIAAFEQARRAEGLTGFTVHPAPAPGRDYVVPITYGGSTDPVHDGALGFDLASEAQRQAAMVQAARHHRPVASGKVVLAKPVPGTHWSGFLIFMPVYARAAADHAPTRGRLLGFVSGPFNAQEFLEAAMATVPRRGLRVSLYDGLIRPDRLLAQVPGAEHPDFTDVRTLNIAGRPLVLAVQAQEHESLSNQSLLTLLFALMVATLLTLLAHVVTRHAHEDLASLDWLEEQVSIRNTLTRELNHRVKNTLANVLSIVALTRRRATSLEQFADSLTGRIMALSATHDLLTGLGWEPAPLRAVIAAELAPYTGGPDHVISVSGPDVLLAPNDALSLGLGVHELATNASKRRAERAVRASDGGLGDGDA